MNARPTERGGHTGGIAEEASRYLDAVDLFAGLGADPHAPARIRAARARHHKNQILQTAQTGARKGARGWTR